MKAKWLGYFLVACVTLPGTVFSGVISGSVTFKGASPKLKTLKMNADPVCHAKHKSGIKSEALVIGRGNALANVFVKVKSGLKKKVYPAPKVPVVLDQKGCHYSPHVLGIMVNQKVKILNPDGTLHNVHALPTKNKEFNMAMPKFKKTAMKSFSKTESMFPIKCDVHPWMGCWVEVLDHPFFSVTSKDGKFEIKGLPAGTFEIEAWHEKLGTLTQKVSVGKNEAKILNFTMKRGEK